MPLSEKTDQQYVASEAQDPWSVLNYEIQQYFGARWLQGYPPQLPKRHPEQFLQVYQNTLIELKALHLRILVDIFLPKTSRNLDDIDIEELILKWRDSHKTIANNLASDYATPISMGLSSKECLNKYLFHPDKRRGYKYVWEPVIRQMDPAIRKVLKTLNPDDPRLSALSFFRKYLDDEYKF